MSNKHSNSLKSSLSSYGIISSAFVLEEIILRPVLVNNNLIVFLSYSDTKILKRSNAACTKDFLIVQVEGNSVSKKPSRASTGYDSISSNCVPAISIVLDLMITSLSTKYTCTSSSVIRVDNFNNSIGNNAGLLKTFTEYTQSLKLSVVITLSLK